MKCLRCGKKLSSRWNLFLSGWTCPRCGFIIEDLGSRFNNGYDLGRWYYYDDRHPDGPNRVPNGCLLVVEWRKA